MMSTKFEEKLAELEELVAKLEQGDIPLEEALVAFKQGVKLSQELTATLKTAENTLTKVINENGEEVPYE
jgi:exodeoxyribonuclease VII small subunit